MVKKKIKGLIDKRRAKKAAKKGILDDVPVPRITNETVAAHREEVLKGARKYIYPLQHSKHRILIITSAVIIATLVGFFTYVGLALYKFHSNSTFLYRVTQVIPFPVAKAGSDYVSYENYLFELRHYEHFYESQQKLDFNEAEAKAQLEAYKQRAMDDVISQAYVKRLAKQNKVNVSDKEVDAEIELVRKQNRLGSSEKAFQDVLKDYWGWSINDFKRSLHEQLLARKLVSVLDTETNQRAQTALSQIQSGTDFGTVAKQYSEDPATKDNGGEYPALVERNNRDINALTVDTLFKLKPGEVSNILNVGYALEIVKNMETQGERVKAAHILFNFKDIKTYVDELKNKKPAHPYIGT